jgi:hypothetical protein
MSVEFYQTRAGRTFFESTMPALVAELARLNDLLAKVVEQHAERPVAEDSGQETERS